MACFFVKQKTAYEMRISDWSSDVCSSDLAGTLPPVNFYKPQGHLNMHAGYSDVDAGDRHIAGVIDALQKRPQWAQMLVVVTFDEPGGWWDHVRPPKGDRWEIGRAQCRERVCP